MNSISDLVTLVTPPAERLMTWLAETTLVASAFAAIALLATRSHRLAPGPSARHAFWLLILIKLVTPPLVHWPWSLAPAVAAARPERVEIEVTSAPPIEFELPEVVESTLVDSKPDTARTWDWGLATLGIASAWSLGSMARGLIQGWRLARFRRTLVGGEPAPDWLIEEAESVGRRLDVRVPPIRVIPRLATPLVWCLGRPVLLVPQDLLKTLESDRWRAILAHELAHLRRGDHWVRRLELVAGLAWWWCPVFWLVCRKLEFEAELASDAWAVWESPKNRVNYAESLIRIGAKFSPVEPPTPALGVVGSGRSFERRLTMILKNPVERRISMPSLFLAASLGALALPSWTLAARSPEGPAQDAPISPKVEVVVGEPKVQFVIVDDEEDDEDEKEAKVKKLSPKQKERLDAAVKGMDKKKKKAMEMDIEARFGPDSEFAKKIEAMGKEIEIKFGDGSEFAKKIEAIAKEIEAKFGPDSEFVKEMESKFGPGSEFAKDAVKAGKARKPEVKVDVEARVMSDAEAAAKAKAAGKKSKFLEYKVDLARSQKKAKATQARRIEEIQATIDKLQAELKSLKADANEDDDQD